MRFILIPKNKTKPPPASSHHKTHSSRDCTSVGGIVRAGVRAVIGAELITPYLKFVCQLAIILRKI